MTRRWAERPTCAQLAKGSELLTFDFNSATRFETNLPPGRVRAVVDEQLRRAGGQEKGCQHTQADAVSQLLTPQWSSTASNDSAEEFEHEGCQQEEFEHEGCQREGREAERMKLERSEAGSTAAI